MKRATSKDVAKLAGVSQTTVSFVMNNTPNVTLPEETRKKVLDAARQLQYVPNSFARGLKTSQSKLLGVFLPTMDNPYYPMLMQYIERYTVKLGYNVILCCTYRNPDREKAYLDLCEERRVDGIVYLFTPNWVKRVTQLSYTIPVVLLSEQSGEIPLNTISLNGFQCGQLVAKHLLGLGHQRIAFLMSSVSSVSLTRAKRLEGVRCAIRDAGLPPETLQVFTGALGDSGQSEAEAGYSIMERLLREEPQITAVIGVNDLVAFGALSSVLNCESNRIPQDISICGFDNIYLSSMTHPKLTTVSYCTEALCELAVDMVLKASEDSDVLKLASEPQLIVRESTGPAPEGQSTAI